MRRWICALMAGTAIVACSPESTPAVTPGPELSRFHGNPDLRIGTQADQPGLGLYDTTTYRWSGLDVDIANYVMTQLGVPATPSDPHIYQVLAADREKQLLSNQKDLIIANYSITDGRIQQGITFTVPYLLSYQDILVRAADKGTIRTVDDLRGKRVCAGAEGTTPFHHLTTINQERGLSMVLRPEVGTKACAEKLNAGEVDAFVSDSAILLGYHTTYPTLHLVGTKVWPRPEQYGIGLVAQSPADVGELNTIIRRMIADGSWERAIVANFCPQPAQSPCHVAQIFLDNPPPVD